MFTNTSKSAIVQVRFPEKATLADLKTAFRAHANFHFGFFGENTAESQKRTSSIALLHKAKRKTAERMISLLIREMIIKWFTLKKIVIKLTRVHKVGHVDATIVWTAFINTVPKHLTKVLASIDGMCKMIKGNYVFDVFGFKRIIKLILFLKKNAWNCKEITTQPQNNSHFSRYPCKK